MTKRSFATLLFALVGCYDPGASAPSAADTDAGTETAPGVTSESTAPDDSGSGSDTETSDGPGSETGADDSTTSSDAEPCVLGSGRVGACRL